MSGMRMKSCGNNKRQNGVYIPHLFYCHYFIKENFIYKVVFAGKEREAWRRLRGDRLYLRRTYQEILEVVVAAAVASGGARHLPPTEYVEGISLNSCIVYLACLLQVFINSFD
jgi:hypothetical protein